VGIIVAPGGGHQFLVVDKEGWAIADFLNANGIAAFVLKYRLARSPGFHYTIRGHALPDANRAVRLVRAGAPPSGGSTRPIQDRLHGLFRGRRSCGAG
jgi:acetyl esterase/lipase